MTKLPLVYIIIVNWNGYEDTIACVESCKKLSYPDSSIVVVDNGSTDGSGASIRERFPDLILIQNKSNLGFTGGNNAGIRYALEHDADYVILLNNDTVVDPHFATALVYAAENDRSIGMLCSKIYFFDRPDVIWYAGASFYPWLGWGRHRGFNERDRGQFDRVEETERPTGCALMVSRELCQAIGLLREEYFCYCEDIDWGMRAQNAHFKIVYVPASRIWHKVSRSTGGVRTGEYLYYFIRNMLLCLDANKPLPFLFRVMRYGAVFTTSLISLFTMHVRKVPGMRFMYRGALHYFQGRFGKLQ